MVINTGKTKVMMFSTYDGTPKLTLPDMGDDYLEVVESVNPTTEGVQILWVFKKSMMERAETPCYYRHMNTNARSRLLARFLAKIVIN